MPMKMEEEKERLNAISFCRGKREKIIIIMMMMMMTMAMMMMMMSRGLGDNGSSFNLLSLVQLV